MDVPHCTSDDESDYGEEDESDEEVTMMQRPEANRIIATICDGR